MSNAQWLAVARLTAALAHFEDVANAVVKQVMGQPAYAALTPLYPSTVGLFAAPPVEAYTWFARCKSAVGGSVAKFMTPEGQWDTYTLVGIIKENLPDFFKVSEQERKRGGRRKSKKKKKKEKRRKKENLERY